MSLELSSDWIPGTIYEVTYVVTTLKGGHIPYIPPDTFDTNKPPLYSLFTGMPSSSVSSDMYMRLKKERQNRPIPINFGDKLLFIEEFKDMRFRSEEIYYEYYKKVLLGSQVLWLHKLSRYSDPGLVRFEKLCA